MKKTTYLFVAMLMAFTMVGCQVDLSDYLTKEEAANTYATKSYVDGKVAELETKINDIDAKFANYYTKGEVDEKGFVTKEELGTLEVISKAVKEYLDTVDWNDYIEDGYTNDEIDAKLKAITDITDKFEETYATLEKLNELSTKVTSLETTVATLSGKVTTLENKPAPSGNGGDGYCGLTTTEVTNIKTLLKQWAENNISGVVYSLTDYVKESDLADYVKIENLPSLEDYAKKTDIKDFTNDIATLISRITTVENMLKADGTVGKKLAELETKVDGKADASLKTTVDTIKAWYEANKDKVTNLNLAAYLTVANAENTYATKSSVEEVASSLAELTSRVETLETILGVKNATNETINKVKLAIASIETNASDITSLRADLDNLKTTVGNETSGLVKQIGKATSDISAIANRVTTLEDATWNFNNYSDAIINGLATTYATKTELETKANASDIPNMNEYAKKTEVVGLVETYIGQEMGKATSNLKSIFNNVYATKTELANYLTSESQIIKDLTSGLANWNVKKGKFIDTETHNACAYYLINDFICIGYSYIPQVPLNATFDELISLADMWGKDVDVDTKDNINRNVVFE